MTTLSATPDVWIRGHRDDLVQALRDAERAGVPTGSVSVQRLEERVVRTISEIAGDAPSGWDEAWVGLTRTSERQADSALVDLVWSLACEQRDDWRENGVSVESASRTFDTLVALHLEAIQAFVLGRLPGLGQEGAMDATVEALARAFEAYWSVDAKRPFRGGSRIRTLLCTIAHREGMRELRRSEREITLDPVAHDRAAETEDAGEGFGESLASAMEECLGELPPKRQLVATCRWRDDVRPAEIAETLGIGRPAVSNHLNKARPALESCLRGKGIAWEGQQ